MLRAEAPWGSPRCQPPFTPLITVKLFGHLVLCSMLLFTSKTNAQNHLSEKGRGSHCGPESLRCPVSQRLAAAWHTCALQRGGGPGAMPTFVLWLLWRENIAFLGFNLPPP